jgi:UDP-N-acetylmuramate dehydrogenase
MGDYCTLRSGGRTGALAVAPSLPELQQLVRWLRNEGIAWRIIGRGSNILIREQGFSGVLIILGEGFGSVARTGKESASGTHVEAGAACPVAGLLSWCGTENLAGLEFMAGIPGSIGGAVYMNAGAWGSEIGEKVAGVSLVDSQGVLHRAAAGELLFTYRRMQPRDEKLRGAVIVGAEFLLQPSRQREILEKCRQYQEERRRKQPLNMPSAGSFFKNPEGDSAGRLIEAAGLKGLRRGDAMVSPVHANFIVNTGRATSEEIVALMQEIQERVLQTSGIRLEPEVHIL